MGDKRDVLHHLIEPAVAAVGFELWGIELISQGKYSTLRIYIDGPDGINVDDCAAVSHQVSGVLDVEDPIAGHYTLEVSSPGLDRQLFTLQQYPEYIGQHLKIRLRIAFDGRRKFSGILKGIEGDEIVLQEEDTEYLLPFELVDKAQLVGQL